MIVRAIDVNNDWQMGKGKSDYRYDINALEQIIKTRLQSFLGDCFFAQNEGIDWWNLMGSKRLLDLRLAVQACILNTVGVNSITELSVSLNQDRNITIQYSVISVYGEISGSINGVVNA